VVDLVLVVDGHRVFAEALACRLRRVPVIGDAQAAFTVEQARVAAGRGEPDVVLLDPGLEGGSGFDLIRHLEVLPRRPHVVVLGDGTHERTTGRVPDGCGWVSKDSPFGHLLQVIRAVRVAEPTPAEPPQAVVLSLPTARRTGSDRGPAPEAFVHGLTDRQADVLHCLLAGLTRTEVATALHLSPNTVRDHVRHHFRITGVSSTAELVSRARAAGLTEGRRLRVVPGP
jgi:DNA-binding NarL/FixJ family response regulator